MPSLKAAKAKPAAGKKPSAARRCKVDGCGKSLAEEKRFYVRAKCCSEHAFAPNVKIAGVAMRFCQQCSSFHELECFDKGKRSCRRRLVAHNARRQAETRGFGVRRRGGGGVAGAAAMGQAAAAAAGGVAACSSAASEDRTWSGDSDDVAPAEVGAAKTAAAEILRRPRRNVKKRAVTMEESDEDAAGGAAAPTATASAGKPTKRRTWADIYNGSAAGAAGAAGEAAPQPEMPAPAAAGCFHAAASELSGWGSVSQGGLRTHSLDWEHAAAVPPHRMLESHASAPPRFGLRPSSRPSATTGCGGMRSQFEAPLHGCFGRSGGARLAGLPPLDSFGSASGIGNFGGGGFGSGGFSSSASGAAAKLPPLDTFGSGSGLGGGTYSTTTDLCASSFGGGSGCSSGALTAYSLPSGQPPPPAAPEGQLRGPDWLRPGLQQGAASGFGMEPGLWGAGLSDAPPLPPLPAAAPSMAAAPAWSPADALGGWGVSAGPLLHDHFTQVCAPPPLPLLPQVSARITPHSGIRRSGSLPFDGAAPAALLQGGAAQHDNAAEAARMEAQLAATATALIDEAASRLRSAPPIFLSAAPAEYGAVALTPGGLLPAAALGDATALPPPDALAAAHLVAGVDGGFEGGMDLASGLSWLPPPWLPAVSADCSGPLPAASVQPGTTGAAVAAAGPEAAAWWPS